MAEPDQGSNLQFERIETAAGVPATLACGRCGRELLSSYFEVNGEATCEACRYALETERAKGVGAAGFFKALVAGGAAALLSAGVWYGVIKLTEREWGILAILVGLLVGAAVRWGSQRRGGWVFQTMAIGLTYLGIVTAYVPLVVEAMMDGTFAEEMAVEESEDAEVGEDAEGGEVAVPTAAEEGLAGSAAGEDAEAAAVAPAPEDALPTAGDAALAIGALLLMALAMPFLGGFENIIGILIIGFALYEAWKLNRRPPFVVNGPLAIGRAGAPALPPLPSP